MTQDLMHNEIASTLEQTGVRPAVNWKQVGWFLGLTFALTWSLDLALYLNNGLNNPAVSVALQLQMLLPAFSAMLLGTFFFKNSPLYFRTNKTASRWFVYYFFLFTLLFAVGTAAAFIKPDLIPTLSQLLLIPSVLGLLLIVILRLAGGKNAFAGAGMAGGKALLWLVYGVGFVLLYALMTALNYVFKLGQVVDLMALFPQLEFGSMPASTFMISAAVNAIIIGPILGLIIAFGEEYGWRGYLQSELTRLGRVRGVLLLGVIWGIWHWPVIWMGYNFPGQPVLGSLLMVGYTIALAFVLAYAVFKSGGVWIAAFLHALNNQTLSFFMMMVYKPNDPSFSFGAGLPGLAIWVLVVLIILRDPVWREEPSA